MADTAVARYVVHVPEVDSTTYASRLASATGTVLVPEMKKRGFTGAFSSAANKVEFILNFDATDIGAPIDARSTSTPKKQTDGDDVIFTRFTRPLDVVGHELTHGVTQAEAGLMYAGQSGALNEHMSDVFGVLVKQFALGQSAREADWLVGAGLWADGVKGVALRSMAAPGTAYDDPRIGRDPQPAHMRDYVDTAADNGGVHINSGIPNHAFFLAAQAFGGYAWERAGRVWYEALTSRLEADADFRDAARATIDVAGTRYDLEAAHMVRAAWSDVGVRTTVRRRARGRSAVQGRRS
mgnify:CR=1 FL=1